VINDEKEAGYWLDRGLPGGDDAPVGFRFRGREERGNAADEVRILLLQIVLHGQLIRKRLASLVLMFGRFFRISSRPAGPGRAALFLPAPPFVWVSRRTVDISPVPGLSLNFLKESGPLSHPFFIDIDRPVGTG